MIYFIADLHFGHENIIKYCNRPFADKYDMNIKLVENWNSVVGSSDTVFVAGDVALCGTTLIRELVGKLNGYKYLIMGNHDVLKMGNRHNPNDLSKITSFWRSVGFEEVYQMFFLDCLDEKYVITHEPIEAMEHFPGYHNIYGHVHDQGINDKDRTCVSVEMIDYKPISIVELRERIVC